MPFKSLLTQAKSRAQDFATQHHIPHPPSHQTPPLNSNSNPPGTPPNKPAPRSKPYWTPSFSPTTPVSTNFHHQLGAHGWGNAELQNYTSSPSNSFHTPDSKLVIRATSSSGTYTSARLTSHQKLGRQRGSLSVTATPVSAVGVWPAFWLLPAEPFQWPNEGEIDILETWNADGINHSCLHWGFYDGKDWDKHRVVDTPVQDMQTTHTYEFVWDQPADGQGGRLVWYIDGRAVMKAGIPTGTRRMEDWQVIINVAMGGNVCQGKVPAEGSYDFVIHEVGFWEEPRDGWGRFEGDWIAAAEGHAA